jgi:segregation and condensation protein A
LINESELKTEDLVLDEILEFEVPEHLYVPTPPLWIESKKFRGPLDLLWYLIRKQNIDILDIPVGLIAAQYVEYLKLMTAYRFEIAPDYLVMAVRLLQIKSQLMLPKTRNEEETEEDPRAFLIQQLTNYEKIQELALFIDKLNRWERDIWPIQVKMSHLLPPPQVPDIELADMVGAYQQVLSKQTLNQSHEISRPHLTLSERMQHIFSNLNYRVPRRFYEILSGSDETLDVAISFQAILELAKNDQIVLEQSSWDDLLWLERVVT